jgi:hypothetical protein
MKVARYEVPGIGAKKGTVPKGTVCVGPMGVAPLFYPAGAATIRSRLLDFASPPTTFVGFEAPVAQLDRVYDFGS